MNTTPTLDPRHNHHHRHHHHHQDGAIAGLTTPTTTTAVVLETLTLAILWSLSLVGNVLVCTVVRRSRRIQSTTNYFVVTLAACDILLAVLAVPFVTARVLSGVSVDWGSAGAWKSGQFFCKVVRFLQHVVPAASLAVMLAIGVDRYYTILYPLSFKVGPSVCLSANMSLVLSVVLSENLQFSL